MSNLETLIKQSTQLAGALVECQGELTPELEAALDLVNEKLPQKIDNYGYLIDRLEVEATFLGEKIKQIADLQSKIVTAHEQLKERMTFHLHSVEDKTLLGNEYKFKLSPTAGRTVVDEKVLPMDYWKTEVLKRVDREKIKADLKTGKEIPGCKIEQTWSFRKTIGSKLLKG
jgi:hypothetical protein